MANLNEAVQLIRQGRKDEARRILEPLLKAEPQNIQTWFWYVETCSTLEQRIKTLEICLKVNPDNPQVRQALQTLRAKQAVAGQAAAPHQPVPPSPVSQNVTPPDWARRSIQPTPPVTSAQPSVPESGAFQPTPAFEFDEHEPEPAFTAVVEPAGGHWQQTGGESKPAFDWEALEKEAVRPDAPAAPEKARQPAPPPQPRGPSLPFYKVWLTALTTQSAAGYAALLDDPEAGAGRAFEWMAYVSVVTGLLSPLALVNTPQFSQLRAMPEFQQFTGNMGLTTFLILLGLVMLVLTPILSVIGLAINAGLQTLLAVLFGGKGTYGQTTYALAAYLVPVSLLTSLLSVIPLVGACLSLPLAIYSIVLNVRALQAAHKLTTVRALMAVFAPGILMFVLCCLLGVLFGPVLTQSLRTGGY